MSRFRAWSDLTRLNATAGRGEAVPIPWRLELALAAADRAHRVTAGRFDPRVLRDLDRLGYAGAPLEATPEPLVSGCCFEADPHGGPFGPACEANGSSFPRGTVLQSVGTCEYVR